MESECCYISTHRKIQLALFLKYKGSVSILKHKKFRELLKISLWMVSFIYNAHVGLRDISFILSLAHPQPAITKVLDDHNCIICIHIQLIIILP